MLVVFAWKGIYLNNERGYGSEACTSRMRSSTVVGIIHHGVLLNGRATVEMDECHITHCGGTAVCVQMNTDPMKLNMSTGVFTIACVAMLM